MGEPLSSLTTPIIIFFIALFARFIFSFLETSITALRLFKLKELAKSIGKYNYLFQSLEKQPHRVLITILVANSLADVTTAALATYIMETVFRHFHLSGGLGFSLGIAIATITLLIFGEIIPKNIAKGRGESLFRSTLWLTNILFYLFYPIVTFLINFSNFVISIFGGKNDDGSQWVSSEREIRFLIDYIHQKGLIEREKTEMLQNIFELGRTPIKEIMVPTVDIISVYSEATIQDVLNIFLEHHFTRLPVYEKNKDNVVGMIHLKDVMAELLKKEQKKIKELIRPILFVPESVKVNQLLRQFRQQHMHMAMVLNEHGSIVGLITLEDLLEEIVGEIADEHEPETKNIIPLKKGGWLVNASSPLEELEEELKINFETEDCLTLGGFLTEKLQRLPKKGERLSYKTFIFQIQKATPKRVLQVLIFADKKAKIKK